MPSHLILVENTKDWAAAFPDVELITARDYLMQPDQYKTKGLHIVNLCRSYRYCSTGYYCSLLAEARRHKIVPSVRTITDLATGLMWLRNDSGAYPTAGTRGNGTLDLAGPGGELGEVGHHAPAFMNQPRWSMKPAPKSRITRISTPSTSQPDRLSTCGPSLPER